MKRFFKVIAILFLLLVAIIIAIPVIFKGEIVEKAKTELNRQVSAEIDFESVSLSLWSSFPHFEVSVESLSINGKGAFEGQPLLKLDAFDMEIDLMSVLFGSQYKIRSIEARDMELRLLTLEDGRVNYDIMIAEEPSMDADSATPSSFSLALQSYAIRNLDLYYEDRAADILFEAIALEHTGQGDFTQNLVEMSTSTRAQSILFSMEGLTYLNRVQAQADFDFLFDQAAFSFRFGDNRLQLNDLGLNFTGNFSMPEEAMLFDLRFSAPENDLKDFISLIPAYYYQDFEDLKTQGTFDFNGQLNGRYLGESEIYPQFDLHIKVQDGRMAYPSLPAAVEDIALDLRVKNETEDLDGTVIDLPQARATIAGNPVSAQFYLRQPISNPSFKSALQGKLDLASLEKVVPMIGYDYAGLIQADLAIETDLSAIEQERYRDISADGFFEANDLLLAGDSLPYRLRITQAKLQISPQQARLSQLDMRLNTTQFKASGRLDNLLAYALSDALLTGSFDLSAEYIDLNDLMPAEAEETSAAESADSAALAVIRLPENIQLTLNARVDTLLYDGMQIKDMRGKLGLNQGKLTLDNTILSLLDGRVSLEGTYNSLPAQPVFSAELKLSNFPFQESFQQFSLLQKLGPIMQYTEGSYSAELSLKSNLGADMQPVLNTVDARGSLNTSRLQTGGKTLEKIAETLNNPEYGRLRLSAIALNFTIEEGVLKVAPFTFKAGNIEAEVSGTTRLNQEIDYEINMELPLSALKGSSLLKQFGPNDGRAKLKLDITGTTTNPKVSTSVKGMAEDLLSKAKQKATEEVEELKKEAKEKLNAKAQELIDAAEVKGDQLIAEAKKRAEQIKAEAKKQADKLRAEADKRAQDVREEAKGNFLKEKAAQITVQKIREEADKKASQLEAEAAKRADQLVQEAKAEKEKLVEDARTKAQL